MVIFRFSKVTFSAVVIVAFFSNLYSNPGTAFTTGFRDLVFWTKTNRKRRLKFFLGQIEKRQN